ncbi:UNVERIFIED_CONTAM: hypothetical protein HDU68_005757, partial [Siphonaria sp. JEL0065]
MLDELEMTVDNFEELVDTLAEASKGLFIWITLVLGNVDGSEKKDYAEVLGEALEDVGEAIVKETGEQIVARLQESASLDLNSL